MFCALVPHFFQSSICLAQDKTANNCFTSIAILAHKVLFKKKFYSLAFAAIYCLFDCKVIKATKKIYMLLSLFKPQ